MKITTVHTIDTEYSADSIEWCPHPGYTSYFACGTYQLEGDNTDSTSPPCRRKGRIYLYNFNTITKNLLEVQRFETAAILDMKWLVNQNELKPKLATANALGQIDIYELDNEKLILNVKLDINLEYPNLLALSLDWNWLSNENKRQILVSDSKGDISLLDYSFEGFIEMVNSWKAHNFEAWVCAFDKWNVNTVYTGGDDTFLNGYDLRSNQRTFINKSHLAGVTCLLSHPKRENILFTGSYDENLRVFDTRSMRQPITEISLKGGIWRLKADPLDQNLILSACMYHNFSIVQINGADSDTLKLVGEYNEHKSICYGADWCFDHNKNADDDENMFMATCSFYDHKLCIASININVD